ncbi:MAG: heavy metal translocating P-type ATPase [Proteobacteria bacterium]|nr:heavy metal translocating P-type ATPase [Pseudomonadota bacterium]
MPKQKTLFFDIEGISCTSCTSRIESNLQEINWVKEISINVATKRARVVVNENIKPADVKQTIKEVDEKFVAHWLLPKYAKHYYFSISGMRSIEDKKRIKTALDLHKEDIINSEVNYSTGIATVTTIISQEPEKNKKHVQYIAHLIESAIGKNKIVVRQFESPIKDEFTKSEPTLLYRRRAIINALVGLPLFIFNGMMPLPLTLFGQFMGLLIGTVTFGIMWTTGKEFYLGAWNKLIKDRSSDMNTLIALGTGSAWFYSMLIVLFPTLFPIVALQYHFVAINMILGIVNFGKGMRASAEEKTKSKVLKLGQVYVDLQPQYAEKVDNKKIKENSLKNLSKEDLNEIHYLNIKEGDILYVAKDKRFPVEGVILSEDETMVNELLRTGEPSPCNKKKGDSVLSGSLNMKYPVYIRATADGPNGELAQTIELMDKASATKPTISRKIDRLATIFVPTTILIAIVSAIGWFIFGPTPALPWATKSVLAVISCVCPCALGLAYPISIEIGMRKQYNKKILVKDATALETAAQVDTVVFDKTGVLTKPAVSNDDCVYSQNLDKKKIIQLVASLEAAFDHPIATAISELLLDEFLPCEDPVKGEQGGVSGKVDGHEILVGNTSHLEAHGIPISKHFLDQEDKNAKKGMSSAYVAINGECVGVIALLQEIRHDAAQTIKELKARDIEVIMLTGDRKEAARAVADKVGISKVYASCNAQKKEEVILRLKARKSIVAMVGDEVNDLRAMEAANLSIAIGSWTNAASKAHVVMQQLNLSPLFLIAKETMNNIDQNLYWTGFYNLLSLLAATGLLYSVFGFVLNPVVASMSMTLSSIFVVLNSMRLNNRIDYVIGVYENKITPPGTFSEWVRHILATNGLTQLLKSTDNMGPERNNKQPSSPRKTTPPPIFIPNREFMPATPLSVRRTLSNLRPIILDEDKDPRPVASLSVTL